MKPITIILGAIVVIAVTTTAVFAVLLFTQTFPPVTRPAPVIVANCTTLSVEGSIPATGTTGVIDFDCAGGVAAFSITTNPATATPTFTLPAGYTSLSVLPHPAPPGCGGQLTSGSPVTFAVGASSDYCANVDSSTAQLATFTITWNS